MDPIRVIERKWGWEIDIPCLKCGNRNCPGNYLSTVTLNNGRNILIRESAYNKKEAMDTSMTMAKMWSMYCSYPSENSTKIHKE